MDQKFILCQESDPVGNGWVDRLRIRQPEGNVKLLVAELATGTKEGQDIVNCLNACQGMDVSVLRDTIRAAGTVVANYRVLNDAGMNPADSAGFREAMMHLAQHLADLIVD